MDGQHEQGADGDQNVVGVSPAARIVAAMALHHVAGDVDLVGETLAGLSHDEVIDVARHAVGIAADVVRQTFGPLAAEIYFRAALQRFAENEVES